MPNTAGGKLNNRTDTAYSLPEALPETGRTAAYGTGKHRGTLKVPRRQAAPAHGLKRPGRPGSPEGKGGTRLPAAGSMIRWKRMSRTDDARGNTFPGTGLRARCSPHGG